ncbi:AMP-binding protein [Bacillus pacificus]
MQTVLKHAGIEKGDRVTIYMPMIPETVVAMLAVMKIGDNYFTNILRICI